MVEKWKKREVINDRKTLTKVCPSFLHYIAGEKNGRSVVVVLLLDNNKETARGYFKRNCQVSMDDYEIVNVNNDFENQFCFPEKNEFSIEKNKRKEMRDIIAKNQYKLLALHSNVIGVGLGCMSDKLGEPCFVLYCVDKSLIPFGEEELPRDLVGYPVEHRDDYVMLSRADDTSPIKPTLSQKGSVHMLVKPRAKSISDTGFLTSAQIAPTFLELYREDALLAKNPFPEKAPITLYRREADKVIPDHFSCDRAEKTTAASAFYKGKSIGNFCLQKVFC